MESLKKSSLEMMPDTLQDEQLEFVAGGSKLGDFFGVLAAICALIALL
jgi:hypothetical protein